jgi:hypothetical protein
VTYGGKEVGWFDDLGSRRFLIFLEWDDGNAKVRFRRDSGEDNPFGPLSIPYTLYGFKGIKSKEMRCEYLEDAILDFLKEGSDISGFPQYKITDQETFFTGCFIVDENPEVKKVDKVEKATNDSQIAGSFEELRDLVNLRETIDSLLFDAFSSEDVIEITPTMFIVSVGKAVATITYGFARELEEDGDDD